MLYDNLNNLLSQAMKDRDNNKIDTLRLIKSELTKYVKDGNSLDDVAEIKILNKMISQRKDSIEQFKLVNRIDLIEKEENEIKVIKEFIPEEPSEAEVTKYIIQIIEGYKEEIAPEKISMKHMKPILSKVNVKYPTINGKVVSEILKNSI